MATFEPVLPVDAQKTPSDTYTQEARLRTIALALEGNASALWALDELSRWLMLQQVGVHLMQVLDIDASQDWLQTPSDHFREALNARMQAIESTRTTSCERLQMAGIAFNDAVISDTSDQGVDYLLNRLIASPVDLLVVGTKSPMDPNTDHCVSSDFVVNLARRTPCSTLVLRRPVPVSPNAQNAPKRVMIAVDGMETDSLPLTQLIALLSPEHVEITLVSVLEPLAYMQSPVILPYVNTSAMEAALRNNAQMVQELTRDALVQAGFKVTEMLIRDGYASHTLLQEVQQHMPDLLVSGSHHRKGFAEWLLGSVSYRLLQSAPTNVLILR